MGATRVSNHWSGGELQKANSSSQCAHHTRRKEHQVGFQDVHPKLCKHPPKKNRRPNSLSDLSLTKLQLPGFDSAIQIGCRPWAPAQVALRGRYRLTQTLRRPFCLRPGEKRKERPEALIFWMAHDRTTINSLDKMASRQKGKPSSLNASSKDKYLQCVPVAYLQGSRKQGHRVGKGDQHHLSTVFRVLCFEGETLFKWKINKKIKTSAYSCPPRMVGFFEYRLKII